jgi:hypothetical protein
MRLESVRNLKLELVSLVHEEMALTARSVSEYGLAARRVAEVERRQPTLALGIAPTKRKGYVLAVRVQRRGMLKSPHLDAIRARAKGEVDMRFIGRVVKRSAPVFRSRQRPLIIGSSIAHYEVTAGTLGCFVRLNKGGHERILSNNHVLADENRAEIGDPILQPGRFDGGQRPRDVVGSLSASVRLQLRRPNVVDCALATIDGVEYDPNRLRGAGRLMGMALAPPEEDERVEKLGRTTGHTRGRVTAFELDDVVVSYDMGNLRFDGALEIEGVGRNAFSAGGDSGSLIFTSGEKPARALLFAGGDQGGSNGAGLTYANPLETVLSRLDATLLV